MRDTESPSYEALYHQLVRLRQEMPGSSHDLGMRDGARWLARAIALIDATSFKDELAFFRAQVQGFNMQALSVSNEGYRAAHALITTFETVIAKLELKLPEHARGAFIPAGGVFDGFQAVAKAVSPARSDVLFVDPWADGTLIDDYGSLVPEHVQIRVLDDAFKPQPSLKPAAARWIAQYKQARPLEVRRAAPRALHDRLIVIDETVVWAVGQSLKDFVKRSPSYFPAQN
jgi:hypothetical protein